MEKDEDVLCQFALFLAHPDGRNKFYRLLQYGAKTLRYLLMRHYAITRQQLADNCTLQEDPTRGANAIGSSRLSTAQIEDDEERKQSDEQMQCHPIQSQAPAFILWTVRLLSRFELVFGDARKVYRFFQFVDMIEMLRTVKDPQKAVRVLRRLRISCFFCFYLLENYVVFIVRIVGSSQAQETRLRVLRRVYMTFWLLSILLAFPLDAMLGRSNMLVHVKKCLDLPVAVSGATSMHLSDGMFTTLGLLSAKLSFFLQWTALNARRKIKAQTHAPLQQDM